VIGDSPLHIPDEIIVRFSFSQSLPNKLIVENSLNRFSPNGRVGVVAENRFRQTNSVHRRLPALDQL